MSQGTKGRHSADSPQDHKKDLKFLVFLQCKGEQKEISKLQNFVKSELQNTKQYCNINSKHYCIILYNLQRLSLIVPVSSMHVL